MKKNFIQFSMRAAVLLAALLTICSATLFTACTNDSFDNPVNPTNLSNEIDYFEDVPGNEGDPAVVAALQSIENVEDLKPFMNTELGQAYYFNYKQLIDHNNPSLGTFKQQVVLTFAGKDAHTILHTQGYSLAGAFGNNHNRLDSISAPHLLWALSEDYGADNEFDLNCVQVEYRYHGFSLPEGDKDSFKYLSAEQQSQDLHAIVTDLKKALITGSGKWISTGVSKNGMTSAQYAYYDEQNGWNDIDVYVPFVAPIPPQEWDIRIGEYMLTQSSKERLDDLKKAYKMLVDDKSVADATVAAYAKVYEDEYDEKLPEDSAFIYTLIKVMSNLFGVQSYGDFATWTEFIPDEKSTPEAYAEFFMLNENDERIFRKTNNARGPLAIRQDPFQVQIAIDQGNLAYDYTWYLDGKLLSDSDKLYFKNAMEESKNSKPIELEVLLLNNLKTTDKKLIFVYGEDDPWTGAAIPDPTNPNVKKYIVPHGTHTDNFMQYAWYEGGTEVAKQILTDIIAILNQ